MAKQAAFEKKNRMYSPYSPAYNKGLAEAKRADEKAAKKLAQSQMPKSKEQIAMEQKMDKALDNAWDSCADFCTYVHYAICCCGCGTSYDDWWSNNYGSGYDSDNEAD